MQLANTQQELAIQFGVTRKTISKWVNCTSIEDCNNILKRAKSLTSDFISAVKAYRENNTTSHHGKVRIAFELKEKHTCSNPSNVYIALKQLELNKVKIYKSNVSKQIPVGKHRTQAVRHSDGHSNLTCH